MFIEMGDNSFHTDLYSPSHKEGEKPYYSLTMKDGKLYSTLLSESIVKDNGSRLHPVNEYLSKAIGFDNILKASDPITREVLLKARGEYLDDKISYNQSQLNEYLGDTDESMLSDNYKKAVEFYREKIRDLENEKALLDKLDEISIEEI